MRNEGAKYVVWLGGLSLIVFIALQGDVVFETVAGRAESERQARILASKLEIGMPKDIVRQIAADSDFDKLRVYEFPAVWNIRAPAVLGAQEWVVVVKFASERVSAIGVRIADGAHIKPAGAPPDKGLCC